MTTLLALGGGEHEQGLRLLEQGRYEEAVAAFRRAEQADGPSAELCYNLALALWKAGRADEAETEAERAATLSDGALAPLRDGILGNLRLAAAQQRAGEDLQGALQAAEQARDHYLRGSLASGAPELARNLERALALIDELRKKQEEQEKQKKQDEEKKEQEQQEQQQEQEQKQEQKQDEPKEQNEENEKNEQQQQQQNEPPESKPEPEPEPGEQKGDRQQQEQSKPQQQQAAPGEHDPTKELTPEQKSQLMRELERFEASLRALRERQKTARPKVEKDW
jgi:Ca-activated chloride channel family protein